MCGIHVAISKSGFQPPSDDLKHLLRNRGPDHLGEERVRIDVANQGDLWIVLTSTVLALRGGYVTDQPFVDASSGSTFCWNGEAWKIGSCPVRGNDGQAIFALLVQASSIELSAPEATIATLRVLQSISGPFAFVFLDRNHNHLFFGRDRLGRRSLLSRYDEELEVFEISSVGDGAGSWREVEANGIYQLSVDSRASHLPTQYRVEDSVTAIAPVYRYSWDTACVENVRFAPLMTALNARDSLTQEPCSGDFFRSV